MTAVWLPGAPLWDSREADALTDLTPPPAPPRDPWAPTERTTP